MITTTHNLIQHNNEPNNSKSILKKDDNINAAPQISTQQLSMSSAPQQNHLSNIDDNQLDIVDANLLEVNNELETQENISRPRPTRNVVDIQETGDIADQKKTDTKDLEAQIEPTAYQPTTSNFEAATITTSKPINPVLKYSSHAAWATIKDYGRIVTHVNDYRPTNDPEKDHIGVPRLVAATLTHPVAFVGCTLGIIAGGTLELGERAVYETMKRI